MITLFSTRIRENYLHLTLLFIRITIACFMLTHGLPKLTKLTSGEPIQFADPFGLGQQFSLILAVFAEVFCSVFIMLGFATRLASFFLLFTMLVAAFHAHADDPFATKEKALLYVIVYATLLVCGSGKYAVDEVIGRKK